MRKDLKKIKKNEYFHLLKILLKELKKEFKKDLISVVLFGSIARGDYSKTSDIDVLIISKSFVKGMSSRVDKLIPVLERVENYFTKIDIPFIQFHPLNLVEGAKFRPLYLDMLTDGIILFDRNNFIKNTFNKMKAKLEELGSVKVNLEDGSWMWVLKPGLKLGEVIDI